MAEQPQESGETTIPERPLAMSKGVPLHRVDFPADETGSRHRGIHQIGGY